MNVAVFHGSPRKGNTYRTTKIFMEALSACGEVHFTEFYLPQALPAFCTGCQLCLSGSHEKCPHSQYVTPILEAILHADALVLTTPHYGACSMSGGMKNLLDHLDFLTLVVAPRKELFQKKAMLISTGSGAVSALKPIQKYLKNWGMNRVFALGLRMFTNQWVKLPNAKQTKFEHRLQRAARKFYRAPKGWPYPSTVFMYYVSKMILKTYIGKGAYPYEHWQAQGYFKRRPF